MNESYNWRRWLLYIRKMRRDKRKSSRNKAGTVQGPCENEANTAIGNTEKQQDFSLGNDWKKSADIKGYEDKPHTQTKTKEWKTTTDKSKPNNKPEEHDAVTASENVDCKDNPQGGTSWQVDRSDKEKSGGLCNNLDNEPRTKIKHADRQCEPVGADANSQQDVASQFYSRLALICLSLKNKKVIQCI